MLTVLRVLAHQTPTTDPDGLLTAWNLHPLVVAGLAGPTVVYLWGRHRAPRVPYGWRDGCAVLGLCALVLALLSPLDALAGELASAHMAQHVLLTLAAVPLLVVAAPVPMLVPGLPGRLRRWAGPVRRAAAIDVPVKLMQVPVVAWLLHVGALWVWHSAVLYEAALRDPLLHGAEHLSFIGTGILFWHAVLGRRRASTSAGTGLLLLFTMAMQGVFLSALLTFASTPWYASYTTTRTWGLDPLTDQQLAGLIMWIPGGLVYVGVALALLSRWIHEGDRGDRATRSPLGVRA